MGDRFQQDAAVEAAPLQDEIILLHPEHNNFCVLNRTATAIWARLAEPATSEEVAADLSAQFAGVTRDDALHDVEATLQHLVELQFITRV